MGYIGILKIWKSGDEETINMWLKQCHCLPPMTGNGQLIALMARSQKDHQWDWWDLGTHPQKYLSVSPVTGDLEKSWFTRFTYLFVHILSYLTI